MKKAICILSMCMLLFIMCACSGGWTDEDLNTYDIKGKLSRDFSSEMETAWVMQLEENETTARGIGIGSTEEAFEKAYENVLNTEFFPHGEPGSKTYNWYYYKNDDPNIWENVHDRFLKSKDAIVRFEIKNGKVTNVYYRTVNVYELNECRMAIMFYDDEESARSFDFELSEQEKKLIQILRDHADSDKYTGDEFFGYENLRDPSTASYLTAEQQEELRELYKKFLETHDFRYNS